MMELVRTVELEQPELCGYPTSSGPCNMPVGHEARWHRHREYVGIAWTMTINDQTIIGKGVNSLNNAISKYKSTKHKLVIEVICQ